MRRFASVLNRLLNPFGLSVIVLREYAADADAVASLSDVSVLIGDRGLRKFS